MKEDALRLAALADEFETECHSENQPKIGDFLNRVEERLQTKLAGLLIPMDIKRRTQAGEVVAAEDYQMFGSGPVAIAMEALGNARSDVQVSHDTIPATPLDYDDDFHDAPVSLKNNPIGSPAARRNAPSTGKPSQIVGNYKLLQKLGEGGMGTVWMAKQEILTLQGHAGNVTSVKFSPDGNRVASGSRDKSVKLWDVDSGKEVLTLRGHDGNVGSVAFSSDGTRIAGGAAGGYGGSIKLWDAASGQELLTLRGHTLGVSSVAFSPSGKQIASASGSTVKLWDADSGKESLTLKGHRSRVNCVAFSPDGTWITSKCSDRTVKLWESKSGIELLTLKEHTGEVNCVVFSPDGKRIASGNFDNTVTIWDTASRQELLTLELHIEEPSDRVSSVAFSADNQRLDAQLRSDQRFVWDVSTGNRLDDALWEETEHRQVSPDGRWLVTSFGIDVLIVDLELKNTPREKAYREAKARPKLWWHREQLTAAEGSENWYAAIFHSAWLLKTDSFSSVTQTRLHQAHNRWKQSMEAKLLASQADESAPTNMDLLLPAVAQEMLKRPPEDLKQ